MSRARNWCFTLNNYTPEERDALSLLAVVTHNDLVDYVVYGHEVGANGTPHLQGFISVNRQLRLNAIRALPGLARAHMEVMRGSVTQAIEYCKKEGDFLEFGEPPRMTQGRRSDLDDVVDWIKQFIEENSRAPSPYDIAQVYPKMLIKYRNLANVAKYMAPKVTPNFQPGQPREWQSDLEGILDTPSQNDRKILFYVDPVGNSGKTWFSRYYFAKHPLTTQILGTGSYSDLAYMIDETSGVFFFNVPRGGMEFLPYRLLESLKDRLVQSNKYESRIKLLTSIPHVVVFSNENPDMTKLSQDRYDIKELSTLPPMGFLLP